MNKKTILLIISAIIITGLGLYFVVVNSLETTPPSINGSSEVTKFYNPREIIVEDPEWYEHHVYYVGWKNSSGEITILITLDAYKNAPKGIIAVKIGDELNIYGYYLKIISLSGDSVLIETLN